MGKVLDRLIYDVTATLSKHSEHVPVVRRWPGFGKVVTGAYSRLLEPSLTYARALAHRSRLSSTTFVGVTGSVGKTTTKELIAAILSTAGSCEKTERTQNRTLSLARTIISTQRETRFCVAEISASAPGYIDRSLKLVRPGIAVVTTIGMDHRAAYSRDGLEGSEEIKKAIAREKGKLVESLPVNGTAVLNADDPLVMTMARRCKGRVITYGVSCDATMQASEIRAAWPERLRFRVAYEDRSYEVCTQLYGRQWVPSVLAALSAGVAAGVPLEQGVQAIGIVPPLVGRMSSAIHDDGVVFIRDDYKAPMLSFSGAFEFLEEAHAERKILMVGTISDYGGPARKAYAKVARRGREAADFVFFVGPRATTALRAKQGKDDPSIQAFLSVKQAVERLGGFFRKGDLVLLKGSTKGDHLHRILLARTRTVACWRYDCGKIDPCDKCPELEQPVQSAVAMQRVEPVRKNVMSTGRDSGVSPGPGADHPAYVVVGLGNPGAQYQNTPHNVGYETLEGLARLLKVQWRREGDAQVAWAEICGEQVLLVKPLVYINKTGDVLEKLGRALGFGYSECIIVHDDLDIPLGKVKTRLRGSDGGHLGVRSILITFQTDQIRRVKIGVARPRKYASRGKVLVPFTATEIPKVEAACDAAVTRVMGLLGARAVEASVPMDKHVESTP